VRAVAAPGAERDARAAGPGAVRGQQRVAGGGGAAGDRLLVITDGVDEARTEDGEFFGRARVAEFAARQSASGLPTPEVMRRLHHAFLDHQIGHLQDDATTLFVEWLTGTVGAPGAAVATPHAVTRGPGPVTLDP